MVCVPLQHRRYRRSFLPTAITIYNESLKKLKSWQVLQQFNFTSGISKVFLNWITFEVFIFLFDAAICHLHCDPTNLRWTVSVNPSVVWSQCPSNKDQVKSFQIWGLIYNHCICTKQGLNVAHITFHVKIVIYLKKKKKLTGE